MLFKENKRTKFTCKITNIIATMILNHSHKNVRNLFAKIVQRNRTATLPNDLCRSRTLRVVTHRYGMTYT